MKECIARALIFSGRPDPTWTIDDSTLNTLEKIWESLVPVKGEEPFIPPLGYRGCRIICNSGFEWLVYKYLVTLNRGGKTESREDRNRAVEKLVISSAPEGLLPSTLLDNKG